MKTIVITGANTGIGFATAEKFIQQGHHVILACRNLEKAETAAQKLEQHGKGKVEVIQLDLNSLQNVKTVAEDLNSKLAHIDILINNAGLMTTDLQTTAEGYEQQFGVNYLAHFLWTQKLLPLLKKAPQGRVIHLASMMHALGRVQPEKFKAEQIDKYNGVLSYGNSKLANLLFSDTLAKKLQGTSVTSNALHPGGVDSDIYRALPKYQYLAMKLFLLPTSKPAQLISEMALDDKWASRNGDYASLQVPAFRTPLAKNKNLGEKLYEQSLQLVKDFL